MDKEALMKKARQKAHIEYKNEGLLGRQRLILLEHYALVVMHTSFLAVFMANEWKSRFVMLLIAIIGIAYSTVSTQQSLMVLEMRYALFVRRELERQTVKELKRGRETHEKIEERLS